LMQQVLAGALLLNGTAPGAHSAVRPRFSRNPFALGVASGYPVPDGMVLWTRLAPEPLAPDGGMPLAAVAVRWELADDAQFRRIVQSGVAYAEPEWAHSVHVEPMGLASGRHYWYRFIAGDAVSATGRTWTAPASNVPLARLRLAVANCQQYEHGYYTAYQQMQRDDLDLIVHVGDYIYELSWGDRRLRRHLIPECYTLTDYRQQYALYRSDADLAAAHAACPWLLTWDDHEVDNDYAGAVSEQDDVPALALARRAAAYRAYYEHQPLPRRAAPFGADLRLHCARSFGNLVNILMLDERQYRSPQACPPPGRAGSNRVLLEDCPELLDESRTMLGRRQEAWLGAALQYSRARWNLLAQGVVMMHADEDSQHRGRYWTDGWNGYAPARARLLRQLRDSGAANPLVLSGDIHAFGAGELQLDGRDMRSPIIASELVATSITSQAAPESVLKPMRDNNANIHYFSGEQRGYLRLDIKPERLQADLVAMNTVTEPHSGASVVRSFVLEDGRRGLMPA